MDTRKLTRHALVVALATLLAACAPTPTTTTAATAAATPTTAPSPTPVDIPVGTHQSMLVAMTGPGTGGVSVTPKAVPEKTFVADIKVRLQKAKANTTYTVQRAPEIGRASAADGVCQRAASTSPWGSSDPAAPAFVTFVGTTPHTITTNDSGAGSLDFEFLAPTIQAGTVFDVMFRLVDKVDSPTAEIRSGCFTVTVK